MRNQGESSVEEILDSIKKVIARDNRDGAIEERRRRAIVNAHTADSDTGDDHASPEPADADEAEEILELSDAELVDSIGPHATFGEETDDDRSEPLTGAAMQDAIRDNFAALSMLAQPGAQPQIVRSGETSLEGLTRDMLRPMLAQWLDTNLPDMVERLVKAEINRIAGKRV